MIRFVIAIFILGCGVAFFVAHRSHAPTSLVTPITDLRLWQWQQQPGTDASGGVYVEGDSVRVEVIRTDDTYWHLQLFQENIKLKEGHKYHLSFMGKANKQREISIMSTRANRVKNDYAETGLNTNVTLTTQWQTFENDFYATNVDGLIDRVPVFVFGRGEPATIWLKNVVLKEL